MAASLRSRPAQAAHRLGTLRQPFPSRRPASHAPTSTAGNRQSRRRAPCTPACSAAGAAPSSDSQPGRIRRQGLPLPAKLRAASGLIDGLAYDDGTEQEGVEQFDWSRQWYPLAPLSYLPKDRPTPYTVLGRQLVVWHHKPTQSWRVLEDRCPHRLAPLSEGRLEPDTGNLQCSYHGWSFGPDGRCTRIPQADSPQQEAAACASPRSCAAAYPVRAEQGMLWVWMDPTSHGAVASQSRALPLPAELMPGPAGANGRASGSAACKGVLLGDWYQRDLPVSFDHLLENLLDPAHVHFAHHGVIGDRARGTAVSLQQDGPLTPQGGFRVRMSGQWGDSQAAIPARQASSPWSALPGPEAFPWMGEPAERWLSGIASGGRGSPPGGGGGARMAGMPATTHFIPPGLVWLEMGRGEMKFSFLFYAVPVSAGTSRIMAGYSTDALPDSLRSALQAGSGALAPLAHALQFLADLGNHEVIDGDLLHIHHQEQVARREGRNWKRSYFMPAAADKGVLLLRRWMDEMAGGGPQYGQAGGMARPFTAPSSSLAQAAPLTRQQILDRYEQHTRHCPSCRRALATVRATRSLLQAATVSGLASAFALAALQALAPPVGPLGPVGRAGAVASLPLTLGLVGLAAGVLQQVLGSLEARFVFVDYVHPEK